MQKPPDWMLQEHKKLKTQWEEAGKPGDFYNWLVETIDKRAKGFQ